MWILCLNFWLLPHPGRKRCEEPQGCFLIRYELPWKHDLWNSYRAWCVVLSSSSWTSLQVRDKKKKAADPSSPWSFHSQVSFTVNTVLCVTAVDDDRIISGQLGCFRRTVELFLRRERWCEEILCSAVWWMKLVHECVKSLLSVQINFRSLSSRAGKKKNNSLTSNESESVHKCQKSISKRKSAAGKWSTWTIYLQLILCLLLYFSRLKTPATVYWS